MVCRQPTAKRGLVRVVRTPEGAVQVDPTGKANGRGAYLCGYRDCWQTGIKKGALARSLKVTLGADDRAALIAFGADLPSRDVDEPGAAPGAAEMEDRHGATTE